MELEKILKEQGYTDEQIKAVLDAMAAGKLYVSNVQTISCRFVKHMLH